MHKNAILLLFVNFINLFNELFKRKSSQKKIKLVLHAGLEKTGTSALQNFFANNAKNLIKQGILYPNVTPQQKNDVSTSGNSAYILDQYQTNSNLFQKMYYQAIRSNCHTVILSSEIMTTDPESLYHILQRYPKFDPYVILYIRELYEFSWTYYQQDLKYSEGDYREYNHTIPPLNFDIWLDSSFCKANRLILCNFDFFKQDIVTSFFKKLLIPIDLEYLKGIKRINRSCTESEHNILDTFWRKKMGYLASKISNAFLGCKENENSFKYYDPEFAQKIYTCYQATINKANLLLSDKEKLQTFPQKPSNYTTVWNRNKIDPADIKIVLKALGKTKVFEKLYCKEPCSENFDLYKHLSLNTDLLMDNIDSYE